MARSLSPRFVLFGDISNDIPYMSKSVVGQLAMNTKKCTFVTFSNTLVLRCISVPKARYNKMKFKTRLNHNILISFSVDQVALESFICSFYCTVYQTELLESNFYLSVSSSFLLELSFLRSGRSNLGDS